MSVLKLSKNDIQKNDEKDKIKLKKSDLSYDSAMVSGWEETNKNSINTLNSYYDRINKGEYLSADDIKTYHSALDNYISTSNRLRGLNKTFGEGYSDEDEKKWTDSIASMNSDYDNASKYYSSFKDEKDYKDYLAGVEERKGLESYDLEAGKLEIDELEKKSNAQSSKKQALKNQISQLKAKRQNYYSQRNTAMANECDRQIATLEEELKGYDDVDNELSEKKRYHTKAERYQNGLKLHNDAVNAEDFEANSGYVSTKYDSLWSAYGLGYEDLTYEYINDVGGMRSKIKDAYNTASRDNPFSDGESMYEEKAYDYITDEEKAIYNYYYSTQGKEKAQEYLDSIEVTLQSRKASVYVDNIGDNGFLQMTFGFVAGVDQFVTGVENLFSDKDYYVPNATQIASGEIRENLGDSDFKIFGNTIGQIGYDIFNTTGNMLPSILVGTVTGGIGGSLTMGVSAAGNAKAEMINLGYSKEQATTYGLLVGASEAGLQYVLGGISSLGGKASGGLVNKVLTKIDNAFARTAIKLGGSMASEGLEESIQTILEPWFKSIVTGVDYDAPNIDEVLYSGLLGALSAGLLEGVGTVAGEVSTYNAGKEVKNAGAVNRLTKLGSTFSADSVAYKLAGKVDENTGAYTIGRLLNEVGATLTEQNQSEIIKSLVRKGVANKDAKTIAEWLYKAVEGEYFTDKQIAILENNDVVSKVFADVIVNQNSTVNQRMQGYAEAINMIQNGGKASATSEATADTQKGSLIPFSNEAIARMTDISSTEGETAESREITSQYQYVADGKTTLNGNNVSIESISSIKDGAVSVRLEDGREVNVRDIDFKNESEALVYEAVANMNPETAMELIEGFNRANANKTAGEQISLEHYLRGFNEAYRYGSVGMPVSEMSSKGFSAELSDEQKQIAYNRGKADAITKVQSKQTALDEKKVTISKTEKVGKKGKVHFDKVNVKSFNARQKASVKALEVVAEALGVDIVLFESPVRNGKHIGENGSYDPKTNTIRIDIYAGVSGESTMLFTASHELTHFIREWSPAKFKTFADFLLEQYGAKGVSVEELVQRQIAKAKNNGRDISYDTAYEEVIADSCEAMLTDSNAIEKLAMLKAKDKGLFNKIKTFIKNLVAKIKAVYAKLNPDSVEANYVREMVDVAEKLQSLWTEALVDAGETYSTIGSRDLSDFAEAKTTDGEELFQYRAMEADKDIYRAMLIRHGLMTNTEIDNLFTTIDKAVDVIKNNLEALDYAWDVDIDDRAFMPVKPNSDSLYKVSLDFSTLCRKRLLQQTIQATLQEALNKPLSKEEGIAIRDELMKIQEEGRQIEIACALCYVESARMKSPTQIKKFLKNRVSVLIDFFAGRAGGSTKEKIKIAESDARAKLAKENPNGISGKNGTTVDPLTAPLNKMASQYAEQIRKAKKDAKLAYQPTPNEQRMIDAVKSMKTSDFTSPEGLENLAKNYSDIFDAYTSFVRNATHSKGIEKDTWWRAGDSDALIGQALIDRMNAENGLRSQSWSDFQVIHLLDYIAATIELSTKNAKRQSYTKVSDYVRLLGNTGDMINMSLIPMAKYNGKLEYDSVEGIDYKTSLELRDKYHATAGTICIGIDNAQIIQLLADLTIDYVIPYHKSSMSQATKKLMHIPSWFDYEPYQSESKLSASEAKENAKKYGVELLSKSDKKYNKSPNFSDWFDIQEARQIAKMENANPSDPAMQKKYGVMYGAYKAMQNAANNYLKLCAERGLAPKFSHQKADFTAEANYWKLLIDRKMVDNVTGEIIEQQAIKPIFDEAEVLGILNRELERYPQVKKDQEYATRKVVEKFLSGDMKIDKDTREAIKKTVDNVTAVNIEASSEGIKFSDRDSAGKLLSEEQQEFFKDSKVRDKDGNLLVVYHSTDADFTVFDVSSKDVYGELYYFAQSKAWSKNFHNEELYHAPKRTMGVYLNITKPLDLRNAPTNLTGKEWIEYLESAGVPISDKFRSFWSTPQKNKLAYGEGTIPQWQLIRFDGISGNLREALASVGYDGIIIKDKVFGRAENTSYVCFEKNQIKNTTNKSPTSNPDIRYSDRVTDKETLDFLENQEHVTVYRAMQLIDGKLYPPMNAYTYDKDGKKVLMPHSEIGAWEQSVERPDLIDPKTGKFKLDKGKVDGGKRGTTVPAAYNPYIHTSLSMLNDQFTSAYTRSNLVVVKGVVPKSELTSGYKAQYAKDSVGETEWHSGVVSTQLPESRKVILSRWFKPVEIVDNDVVAQNIKKMLGNTGIEIPYNVVSPKLRRSLEKIGVPIGEGRGIRNLPSKNDVKYSDRDLAPTFYSQMGKVVEGMKQDKFGASSVIPMLRGRGVKAEEIRWSGIATWLEGKKSVTKQELLEFIQGSQLQIGEQMSNTATFVDEDGNTYTDNEFKEQAYALAEEQGIDRDRVKFVLDPDDGSYVAYAGSRFNGIILEAEANESSMTRWSEYKLDGGTNYREIVFTMPNSTYSNRAMKGHWGQDAEGVLAHARIQDFKTVSGKKMLFIEEIQSDWHNEGHSKGYSTEEYEDAVESYDKLYNEYKKLDLAFHKYVRSNEFMTDPEDVRKKKHDWLRGKAETAQKKYLDAEKVVEALKEKGAGDTPDAPFKDTYHEYVLKRLLRMAAEQGYDIIGWTPAYMQEMRWSEDYAEGYRIEYDQDMPKFLKKYGRQWGAKVELGGEHIWQPDAFGYEDEQVSVWSMDIPDSMKDSVLHEGQVLYSDRNSQPNEFNPEGKTLKEQLEDAYSTSESFDQRYVYVGRFTDIFRSLLQDNGIAVNDYPVAMNYRDAYLSMHSKETGKYHGENINYHDLGVDGLESALESIKSPVNILKSKKDSKIELVLQSIDKKGNSILSIVAINQKTLNNRQFLDAHIVTSVYGRRNIEKYISKAEEEGRLIKAKKEESTQGIPQVQYKGNINANSSVSTLPQESDVVKGFSENSQKYSDRDTESVSNRSLLANALESATQNDTERNKLAQYKAKIELINAEEQKLHELREQIKEISFSKGKRDVERLRELQFEANQTANRINTYDRQLLTLEASKPLKAVLEREKQLAYKKAEQKGKDALAAYREKTAKTTRELMTRYQESRKKATEGRHKTEIRHKIKDVVSKLNQLLLRPTKDKHIKEELRMAVANALSAINMDTVGADDRVAKYNDLIAKTSDPDMIAELTKSRDRIALQGEALKDKLTALQTAYEKVKNSTDSELKNAYQEPVMNAIKNVVDMVGSTSLRDMNLTQLEAVYEMYSMVLHTVQTANKAFKAKKGETITQISEAVNDEIRKVSKEKFTRNPLIAWLRKVGWTLLKPFTAFRTIGSDTFTGLFTELRNGEDVYYGDISEAKSFLQGQYKKYNFKSWNQKQPKTFTAKSGKTFTLTLEQMMSLYAYSRRDQAHDHIIEGGIVLEDSVIETKNKLGLPVKYKVDTKSAFNISEETLQEICDSLTAEQKAFVEDMQAYLSDVMGAKGNEVSMELLGVKLFKEKFYFPLKSSKYYMGFKPEEAGEIKLKNPAFSKETVQHANNPVVLKGFTDVWATHINDMSMYHAFVLPLEDFTRVYNYKTRTDAKLETMSTEATIANAYGEGATQYIRNFLKSLNGGVRADSIGVADKLTGLAKKGAVLGSASVVIQQPSAIMRAMAYIDPKYFIASTPQSLNLIKHNKDWAELKQYAPIAGIKEMGRFDVGMGQSTVKWIKDQDTVLEKADEILSKAPAIMDELTWVSIWQAIKKEVKATTDLEVGSDAFLEKCGDRFTEVVSLSQVYDSVFSRSDIMRNQSWIAKTLTAFMAEPTTTLNMLWDSMVQGKRTGSVKGYLKVTTATSGAIVGSIVLNAALKSIITAMRDDDEEESYAEKYIEALIGNTQDGINPLTYIPVVKDIWSIFQGYDVGRMDMDLFADLQKAIDAMDSESKTEYEKWTGLIGSISALFGVPYKNVERDIRGAYNTIKSFIEGEKTTKGGILNSIREGWTGKETSNTQQLYDAYLRDDKEQIKRVEGRFEDKSAIESALRKALRDNDSRIREAAQAVIDGNHAERIRLTKEIVAEGHFRQDIVVGAINAELTAIRRELKDKD